MGNTLKQNSKQSLLSQISVEYEEIKQDCKGIVLLHKQSQNCYILKEYTYCSQFVFQSKVKELREQIDKGCREYVISPVRLESKIFSSFCSSSYKIYAIFEYPQVTLREEINARQKQNKNFEEAELWSILQSCTNALSELKPLVSLNPNQIFINPDGHLKIIHDDLFDENYRAVLNDRMYYAPEKLKNFSKIDSDLSLRKESIFSMGMTILEAARLSEIEQCYDFNSCQFVEQNMMIMLEYLSEKYSPQFLEILGNILEINPNRRASLMEVQKILDNYWGAEELQNNEKSSMTKSKKSEPSERASCEKITQQLPLNDKCTNKDNQKLANKETNLERKVQKIRQRQITIPQQMSSFKLQKPKPKLQIIDFPNPATPKNHLTSINENNLYTDPKLLEMIRKDLEDINKLKQSAFYETSKYTFMYPQTQTILNSIKNFQTEPKHQALTIPQFSSTQPIQGLREEEARQSFAKRGSELVPTKMMMKKNTNQLVYTIETYENGRRYEGTTFNGKKHGKGKLIFQDGAYYEGDFKQDKMNGKGILYYSENSPAYDGEWHNDQFNGFGILYNQNPQGLEEQYDFRDMNEVQDFWARYEGQFILDNKSGNGRLFLTNGQVFEGEFSEDSVNGSGRYTCMGGETIEGVWEANMLVDVLRSE